MVAHRLDQMDRIKDRVASTARAAGLELGAEYPRLVRTWRTSETATVYHFKVDPSARHDLVVKLLDTPAHAAAFFSSMAETAKALEEFAWEHSLVLRPLGLSEDLGAVIMPHVSGRPLGHLLQREPWTPQFLDGCLLKLIHGCGVLLAGYHTQLADRSEARAQAAWEDLQPRIATVLGRQDDLRHLAGQGVVAKCHGDFQPDNIIVTENDKLALIDPPVQSRYRYTYRDLALFTYKLYMFLLHPLALRQGRYKIRRHGALVDAFLEGYASGRGQPLSDNDRFFINGCEAFLLRRRWGTLLKRRAYLAFVYHLVPLRHRYTRLRQAMLQHLQQTAAG